MSMEKSLLNVGAITQSLYAWILLFVSGFAGIFLAGLFGFNIGGNIMTLVSSSGLFALLMGLSIGGILMIIITLLVFYYLHREFIGNISFLEALLILIIPGLVDSYVVGLVGASGGFIGIILSFLVFHIMYQLIKQVV